MRSILLALAVVSLVPACGDDGGGSAQADAAANVPAMITITGQAAEVSATGGGPLAGVAVSAFRNGDDSTAIATATTDASGNYTITITTNGQALDGYLKATLTGFTDTYLYPPFTLAEDFDGASLKMITSDTGNLLSTICQANQDDMMKGKIAVIVASAPDTSAPAVAGVTVSSSPAAGDYCYNDMSNHLPANAATATADDGIGYMFNVTGEVTVSAMKSGSTFKSHKVTARVGALTTTLIVP